MSHLDDEIENLYRGWMDKPAHPNSPSGGGGAGGFSQAYPLGSEGSGFSRLPHPHSPAGRELIPQDIDKALNGQIIKNKTISERGLTLLKQIEMLRLIPYDDQTGKETKAWTEGATIGYGHLILKTEWDIYKNGLSESSANFLFQQDISPFIITVQVNVMVKLKQNEFDALVMFAYNIGKNGFIGSSVIKLVNTPNADTSYKNLETAWKAWNKSQGKVMKGLDNRRQCEWNIYSKNVYERW